MTYIIDTLGCKVNQYETQAMETLLRRRGHVPAAPGERADAVVVNTCAVTAQSGHKSRQAVRHLMEANPGALSVVCGCWAQVDVPAARALGADIVWGSGDRAGLVEAMERALSGGGRDVCVDKPFERRVFEELPAGAFEGHARAYLKIEDGCENFCSYCIIPYARGRVRSLPPEDACAQARALAAEGYRELVVTGIEIASYGRDLPGAPKLEELIRALAAAAPELRLHLSSLEPSAVTEEFCRALAETGRVCDHFHLSLQSGCDAVLRAMRRKYDTAGFLAAAERLRRYFPGCALTADLIAGFPGETEENHAETLAFLRKCGFSALHVFPYSRRPGTPADKLPGQLTHAVKARRAAEAAAAAEEMKAEYLRACVGRTLSVIFERSEAGESEGHAANYTRVCVRGGISRGVVKNVKITGVSGEMLVGDIV